jgi:hypothetical protein
MSLVVPAPKPDAATEPAIKNTHFWPDINPVELRDTLRLEGTVTAKRLRAVIKYALTEVNAELYSYRVAQLAQGYKPLADVPADQIDDESIKVCAYLRAVSSLTAAILAERYPNSDTTDAGSKKAEIVESTVDELWRDARNAISDVAGVSHCVIGLL